MIIWNCSIICTICMRCMSIIVTFYVFMHPAPFLAHILCKLSTFDLRRYPRPWDPATIYRMKLLQAPRLTSFYVVSWVPWPCWIIQWPPTSWPLYPRIQWKSPATCCSRMEFSDCARSWMLALKTWNVWSWLFIWFYLPKRTISKRKLFYLATASFYYLLLSLGRKYWHNMTWLFIISFLFSLSSEDLFLNSTSGYRCYDIMAEVVGRPTKGELHGPVKPPDMGHWQYQACTSLSKQVFDSFIFSVCAAILRAVVTMMFFDI